MHLLCKLIVSGPDAGTFLDLIYTNMISNLAIGKVYGLMCSENGFLIDDGVVARLDEILFFAIQRRVVRNGFIHTWKSGCKQSVI